eukprot:TRINITY_DN15543_c0_g1_i1.p1 TRINITY_DN15543_c0_g1~~TRINITY_DN15543_c0_g1_i1.p1  ORF type:complete len:620 (+),score=171.24 TRINITY_DN15543_c0_g1_i1:102-1961(+)
MPTAHRQLGLQPIPPTGMLAGLSTVASNKTIYLARWVDKFTDSGKVERRMLIAVPPFCLLIKGEANISRLVLLPEIQWVERNKATQECLFKIQIEGVQQQDWLFRWVDHPENRDQGPDDALRILDLCRRPYVGYEPLQIRERIETRQFLKREEHHRSLADVLEWIRNNPNSLPRCAPFPGAEMTEHVLQLNTPTEALGCQYKGREGQPVVLHSALPGGAVARSGIPVPCIVHGLCGIQINSPQDLHEALAELRNSPGLQGPIVVSRPDAELQQWLLDTPQSERPSGVRFADTEADVAGVRFADTEDVAATFQFGEEADTVDYEEPDQEDDLYRVEVEEMEGEEEPETESDVRLLTPKHVPRDPYGRQGLGLDFVVTNTGAVLIVKVDPASICGAAGIPVPPVLQLWSLNGVRVTDRTSLEYAKSVAEERGDSEHVLELCEWQGQVPTTEPWLRWPQGSDGAGSLKSWLKAAKQAAWADHLAAHRKAAERAAEERRAYRASLFWQTRSRQRRSRHSTLRRSHSEIEEDGGEALERIPPPDAQMVAQVTAAAARARHPGDIAEAALAAAAAMTLRRGQVPGLDQLPADPAAALRALRKQQQQQQPRGDDAAPDVHRLYGIL